MNDAVAIKVDQIWDDDLAPGVFNFADDGI